MLPTLRKIAGVLRGGGHPVEVGLGAALGALAGLVLGKNGLAVVLVCLAFVLSFNRPIFGLATAAFGALSWPLAPVLFAAGRAVLSLGFAATVFGWLSNAPVGALMGFDTYSVAGGLALGLPAAVVAGLAAWWATHAFRRRALAAAPGRGGGRPGALARFVRWLFLGTAEVDHGRMRKGRPRLFRRGNLALIAVLVVLGAVAGLFDYGPYLRRPLERGLTELAGAQADVANVVFRPLSGSVKLEGLAVTDAEAPERNAFEAKILVADVGLTGLLRRSFVIDEVRFTDLALDTPRAEPGRLVERPPETLEEPEEPSPLEGASPVDLYVGWRKWKDRFDGLRRVVTSVRDLRRRIAELKRAVGLEREETEEELARRAEAEGHASVRATEVPRTAPDFLLRSISVEGIRTDWPRFGAVDVEIENLAYPAGLSPGPAVFRLKGSEGGGALELAVDVSDPASPIAVKGSVPGLPAKDVTDDLGPRVPVAFEEGALDCAFTGTAGAEWIDLRLDVRGSGVRARPRGRSGFAGLAGSELEAALASVEEFDFALLVRGELSRPAVRFEGGALVRRLKEAALKAAKDRLKEEVREERERLEEKVKDKVEDAVRDALKDGGRAGEVIDGLLGR
jgi:uncharacterized protein (TIGR03546 family)